MSFKSSFLAFSFTLALAASGYTSNAIQSQKQANSQSQNASSKTIASDDSSTAKAAAPEQDEAREGNPTVVDKPGNSDRSPGSVRRKSFHRPSSKALTRFIMKYVDFHTDDTIVYRIRHLQGLLLRTSKTTPPTFDDKKSFILSVDSGIVGLRVQILTDLLNNYAFGYANAPLKDFVISTQENKIKMEGKMHKVAWLPFEIVGDLSATPEGKIQLHPTSIKVEGLPVKGLLSVFGVELDELIKVREERGVKIDDNDIIMDPERITPPPAIRGKVTAVLIEGDEVIQFFGTSNRSSSPNVTGAVPSHPMQGRGYMHYRGGTIRFGKLTMNNADLKIVDANPKDVFDFSIDDYNRQLVAGYSKNTPRYGLVTTMPDYYKLRAKQTESRLVGAQRR